jgi:hypothetical protein
LIRAAFEARLAAAEALLDEVTDIYEMPDFVRGARLLADVVHHAQAARDIQNRAAELVARAYRRMGALLLEMPMHQGGRPSDNPLHDVTGLPTLRDIGITRRDAAQAQEIARLPEGVFVAHLDEVRAHPNRDLSIAGLYRHAVAHNRAAGNPDADTVIDADNRRLARCPRCGGQGWVYESND